MKELADIANQQRRGVRFYFYIPPGAYQLPKTNEVKEALAWYPDIKVGGMEWDSPMYRIYNGKVRLAWIPNTAPAEWIKIDPEPLWNVADLICSKPNTGDSVTCQNRSKRDDIRNTVRNLFR